MARSVRRSFRRGTQSPTAWAGISTAPASLAAGSKVLVANFVPNPGLPSETLVRTRGLLTITNAAARSDGAFGACVVSDSAITAGVASIPDPITEINDDLWTLIVPIGIGETADPAWMNYEFDSKGMRRIEEGQSLAFVLANGGGGAFTFQLYLRTLAKIGVRT